MQRLLHITSTMDTAVYKKCYSRLFFDKFIDVVLGPVLGSWHLEDIGDAEESFLSVSVSDHLKM